MTKNEVAYILGFLTELYDKFSTDGCNDMYLPDTPENREMYLAAEKLDFGDSAEPLEEALQVPYGNKGEKKIGTNNQTIVRYLRERLMQEFGLKEQDIPKTDQW